MRRGFAAEHQNGEHAAFQPGFDIGIEAVANHGHLPGGKTGAPERGLHDAGMGLADDAVGAAARAGLDKGHDCANIGRKAGFRGAVKVRMRSDIGKPGTHEIAHGGHLSVIQGGIIADDHDFRVLHIHRYARLAHFLNEEFIAQHKGAFAGIHLLDHGGGGFAGGKHLFTPNRKPHALQALDVKGGIVGRIVGQKQEIAPRFLHAADELQRAGDNFLPQIKGAVHIQQEAAHVLNVHASTSPKEICPFARLFTAASASTR